MKNMHTFSCPVFALQNALTAGHSIPWWNPRACIGLNLGPIPMHARNVYLVLLLLTGLVSPQFHCCFDDFFETCKYGVTTAGTSSTQATWQHLAGFKRATINPTLMTNERLLGTSPLNDRTSQGSQIPPGDVSISNSQTHDESVANDV